jgi:DNA-binding LacI/PurR family transcriptional regulator
MQGFLEEVNDADLRTHPPILGDWTAEFGYHAGLELLANRDFSAVFAANDQMALGLLHAFRESGLDVPGDISVVGFDDIPEARHYWPSLTTVRQDFVEIGRRAVEILLEEINGGVRADTGRILPTLVVRGSTAIPG